MGLQEELDRVIAGYPLMSDLERHVILGLIEQRLSASRKSDTGLRLVTVNGSVLPGGLRQPGTLKKKFASLRR
jgi:hypothetical protein